MWGHKAWRPVWPCCSPAVGPVPLLQGGDDSPPGRFWGAQPLTWVGWPPDNGVQEMAVFSLRPLCLPPAAQAGRFSSPPIGSLSIAMDGSLHGSLCTVSPCGGVGASFAQPAETCGDRDDEANTAPSGCWGCSARGRAKQHPWARPNGVGTEGLGGRSPWRAPGDSGQVCSRHVSGTAVPAGWYLDLSGVAWV